MRHRAGAAGFAGAPGASSQQSESQRRALRALLDLRGAGQHGAQIASASARAPGSAREREGQREHGRDPRAHRHGALQSLPRGVNFLFGVAARAS